MIHVCGKIKGGSGDLLREKQQAKDCRVGIEMFVSIFTEAKWVDG